MSDKSEILELQMKLLAQIGGRFYNKLQEAKQKGISDDFYQNATALINQLSGSPDSGALEAMNNIQEDVAATKSFLDRWDRFADKEEYSEVLKSIRATLTALTDFKSTLDGLSTEERREVERYANLGRSVQRGNNNSGCLSVISFVTVGLLSMIYTINYWV